MEEIIEGYTREDLKKIYEEAVAETNEFWLAESVCGNPNYHEGTFAPLESWIGVDKDGEIYHFLDLPWSSDNAVSESVYFSRRRINLLAYNPTVFLAGEYANEFISEDEFWNWVDEVSQEQVEKLEFISFDEFLEAVIEE